VLVNKENAKEISVILLEFMKIMIKNEEDKMYKTIQRFLVKFLQDNKCYHDDRDDENTVSFLYQVIIDSMTIDDKIAEYYINKDIINSLLDKLDEENTKVKNYVFDIVSYLIKKTKKYNRELFDLKEDEKEGQIDYDYSQLNVKPDIIKILFKEKNELLKTLLIISCHGDIGFTNDFLDKNISELYKISQEENKIDDFLDILCSFVKINDKFALERLFNVMGYTNLIIKPIPKKQKEYTPYNNRDSDSDDDDDNEKENEDPAIPRQNWPLFGERLIDGNINKQIYEYISIKHWEKEICLLGLLFPNENDLEKEEKEEKKEDNEWNDDDDEDKNDRKKKNRNFQ
jgi:hypothetical protein